jgi:4-aminobutyrate aminotransferase-like enzyme
MNKHHLIPVIPFAKTVMSCGEGSHLFDIGGKKFIDLNAGQFCTVLGHSNPSILNSIWSSISKLVHTSTDILSADVVSCSNNIYRISGDMRAYSIMLSTGAEVVEFCLRYAKFLQRKNGIICFDKGYHGLTLGAQSITFSGAYTHPNIAEIYNIPIPTVDDTQTSIKCLEKILVNNEIAALFIEPIVSVGGMLFPPAEWFQEVRVLCNKYQIFLLLDECQTGFGRTGNWFAYQTYGFVPDMVATAKGIGMGFPVSVAMFRDTLIPESGATYSMAHFSSHQNDPFAAGIINAGIEYMEKQDLLPGIRKKGTYFLQQLKELEQKNSHIRNARGCGLMLGVDLSFDTGDYREIYKLLHRRMMEHGVIIQGTNGGRTLRFLPDYLIEPTDINYAVNMLHQTLLEDVEV